MENFFRHYVNLVVNSGTDPVIGGGDELVALCLGGYRVDLMLGFKLAQFKKSARLTFSLNAIWA